MSKKSQKTEQSAGTEQGAASTPAKRGGRKPMTEAQKAASQVARGLKNLSKLEPFTDPTIWAKLDPVVLGKVEASLVHVRTVVHAAERDALRARLAALDGQAQA